jgi:hypothetical protein
VAGLGKDEAICRPSAGRDVEAELLLRTGVLAEALVIMAWFADGLGA